MTTRCCGAVAASPDRQRGERALSPAIRTLYSVPFALRQPVMNVVGPGPRRTRPRRLLRSRVSRARCLPEFSSSNRAASCRSPHPPSARPLIPRTPLKRQANASSVRERTPTLRYSRERCHSTVLALKPSAVAASRLVAPRTTSRATRTSLAVYGPRPFATRTAGDVRVLPAVAARARGTPSLPSLIQPVRDPSE
jgi:hypothetical protein